MKPILIPERASKVMLGEKEFTYKDVKNGIFGIERYGLSSDWFGGRVRNFGKTVDGFLLCIEGVVNNKGAYTTSDNIIGIYVPSFDNISKGGLRLLKEAGYYDGEIEDDVNSEPIQDKPLKTEDVANIENLDAEAKLAEIVNKRIAKR